jgi:hypothetical protein
LHRYIVEKGMSVFTDVIDSTGYSDFNKSQKVSSGISVNLDLRALSTFKVTSSSRAFKGRDASVALPIPFFARGLEIFTELLVKGI